MPAALGNWIAMSNIPETLLIVVFMIIYLGLGCILDSISMMMLTMPIVFPIAMTMGWDPVWFGIIIIIVMECGLLTPPVGLSVFTAKAVAGSSVTLEGLFKACIPFFFITLLALVILIAFPIISTWLPSLM